MTVQPTRDQLREAAEGHLRFGGGGDDLANGVLALLDALDQAEARIKAVRELHSESRIIPDTPVFGCAECGEPNETEPCATVRALDGDQ